MNWNINYGNLPPHMRGPFKRYIENRISMGSFGTALVENNLSLAFATADHINTAAMQDIVAWMNWEMPSDCWGSPAKVIAWLEGE